MLNLGDENVGTDYGKGGSDLFPFDGSKNPEHAEPYGSFEFTLLSYDESGPCGTEKNKGDKEYDLVTARIDSSTNPAFKPGEVYGFFFQTGGNGMSVKSRPYKIQELRAFVAAAHGVGIKDIAVKDYPAKRQELLDNVFEGTDKIKLRTKRGNERTGENAGTYFRDDVWSPA